MRMRRHGLPLSVGISLLAALVSGCGSAPSGTVAAAAADMSRSPTAAAPASSSTALPARSETPTPMPSSSPPAQAAVSGVVSVQRRYPLPGDNPGTLAAVDGGIVAVLGTADGLGVVRVDLATGRVLAPTDLRGFLGPVVVAGGLVWVPGPPGVWGLDPRTLAHRVTVGVGTPVEDLAAAGGLLWAVGWASLTGIDPATGRVVQFTSLSPGTETTQWVRVAAAPNGTALWTTEVPGSGNGPVQVQVRDPHTGAITGDVNTHLTVGLLSSLAATNDRAWASYSTPHGLSANELQVNAVGDRLTVAPSQTSVQFSNAGEPGSG